MSKTKQQQDRQGPAHTASTMARRAALKALGIAALAAALPGSALAGGLFDVLGKLQDKESKESHIFQGVGNILASGKEMDFKSERTIGESLALEGFKRYGLPLDNEELQKYVNLVGLAVARNSLRPNIPYKFVVVKSGLQNAFSCPGGIVFVSSGLFSTVDNEAELACVLAHEVTHVARKHAIQSIKRARFFEGVGQISAATMKGDKGKQFESMIGDLQNTLFDKGLDKNMEFEADAGAMEAAYRTGYGPQYMIAVLQKLKTLEARAEKRGSWFSTHPPLDQRIARCNDEMRRYRDWKAMSQPPARLAQYRQALR